MKLHEIMSSNVRCIAPDKSLTEAARLMRELNVGSVPICDHDRLAGMLTDRDLTVRATAEGRDPNATQVREVMSAGTIYAYDDQTVEEAAHIMEQSQIRRLPVLNRQKRLVGIVSLGDLALHTAPAESGEALREISQD